MKLKLHKYGWLPDVPDRRDIPYKAPRRFKPLPHKVSLRSLVPNVFNQGTLGSCTANALASAYQLQRVRQALEPWHPSRLFLYYNERVMIRMVKEDSGAYLRDGIKSLVRQGVCPETLWPYDVAKFTQKPNRMCYGAAEAVQVLGYRRVSSELNDMKAALAQGLPFVVGISLYESFETEEVARTGKVPLPSPEERMIGGHAILCVGYDDTTRRFELLNSWGKQWGDAGFFTVPFGYLTNENLADDRWAISLTEIE